MVYVILKFILPSPIWCSINFILELAILTILIKRIYMYNIWERLALNGRKKATPSIGKLTVYFVWHEAEWTEFICSLKHMMNKLHAISNLLTKFNIWMLTYILYKHIIRNIIILEQHTCTYRDFNCNRHARPDWLEYLLDEQLCSYLNETDISDIHVCV